VSDQTIWLIESGRQKGLRQDTAEALGPHLGVSATYLQYGENSKTSVPLTPEDFAGHLRSLGVLEDDDIQTVTRVVEGFVERRRLERRLRGSAALHSGDKTPAASQGPIEDEGRQVATQAGPSDLFLQQAMDASNDEELEILEYDESEDPGDTSNLAAFSDEAIKERARRQREADRQGD
jgi:hypothetical protein